MTTLVLIAILIVVIVKARRGQLGRWNYHDRYEQDRQVGNPQREAELEREVEELRERIQVLERIATDGRSAKQLSDEIDKLRDK